MNRTISILHEGIQSGLHPGAQLYVSLHGRTIVDDAFGDARLGVPMTPDTLVLWMSAGKPVTAIAALQLVQRGLIDLDTRVAQIIPEFGANGKEAITLRHLLTHTAGFRGPLNNFTPGTWEDILARVYALRQEPGWAPGQKAGYHIGSSWFVLGELVQRLAGALFPHYVRENIFEKLKRNALRAGDSTTEEKKPGEGASHDAFIGMSASEHASLAPRFASMFVTEKAPLTDQWPGNTAEATLVPRPGANARGPFRLLAHIYESLLFDERLLSRPFAQKMMSPQRVGLSDQTFKQTLDWGYGVMIDSKKYAGEHQYGYGPHASPGAFGHSGNQSSCAFADPAHGLVVAWATNGMPGEEKHQARQRAINKAIYEDLNLV